MWSNLINKFVNDSCVGEGSSGHDLVVSSSGTICVEVGGLDGFLFEVSSGWGVFGDVPSGGDVVGGDGVAEVA